MRVMVTGIGLALVSLLAISTAHAETEDRSWHLLQKQHDGLIRSVQHGLTQHECEFARARVMGLPATDEEKAETKAHTQYIDGLWEKWEAENGCDRTQGSGWTSGPSFKVKGGYCMRGEEFARLGEGMRSITMTDIASAECFQ